MRRHWKLCVVGLLVTAVLVPQAIADTHAVIVNQSGQSMILNFNTQLKNGTAVWTPLKATVLGPGDARMEIVDTGKKCRQGGWAIDFRMYSGDKLFSTSQYCIGLALAEVGCLGVHFVPGKVGWNKVPFDYCSSAWWTQHGSKAFDQVVRALEAAAKLKK